MYALLRDRARDALGGADRQFLQNDLFKKGFALLGSVVERHRRPRVALVDLPRHDGTLHVLGQGEQAERVRDIFAALADFRRAFGMRDTELVDELLERFRAVDGVEVFSLKILDDGEFELGEITIALAYNHRYLPQAREPTRAQAPFACDKLVYALEAVRLLDFRAAHHQGLQDAVLADALGERLQPFLAEVFARLVGVRHDALDVDPEDRVVLGRDIRRIIFHSLHFSTMKLQRENVTVHFRCWSGGIGIRARLKIVSRKGCGFDSHLQHLQLSHQIQARLERVVARLPGGGTDVALVRLDILRRLKLAQRLCRLASHRIIV